MRMLRDIRYGEDKVDKKRLDVYFADGKCKAVFLYIHGGGIENGDKDGFFRDAGLLAKEGYASISINYPLYPDTDFSDFIYAAAQATVWAKNNAESFFGTDKLYIGGESAGAYISMMLCFDARYLESVGLSNDDISGYWFAAGQPTAHFNVLKYSGEDPKRVIADERAPIYFVGMADEYPPMRFIVSNNDMFSRYEQTVLMVKTLEHFGYEHFDFQVVEGTHCSYFKTFYEDGTTQSSHMILDFLENAEKI